MKETNKVAYLLYVKGLTAMLNECDSVEDITKVFIGLGATNKGLAEQRAQEIANENTPVNSEGEM